MASLRDASEHCAVVRWRGTRNASSRRHQIEEFIRILGAKTELDDVTSADVSRLVSELQAKGNSPATIKLKLSVLGTIWHEALIAYPPMATRALPPFRIRSRPVEKWWLTPEDQKTLTGWLRGLGRHDADLMADYIDFVVASGLRVEEALRLEARHFSGLDTESPSFLVPGTKTAGSSVTLPLFHEAAEVARRRMEGQPSHTRMFPILYRPLAKLWRECAEKLGVTAVPTATLKNLRRSFGGWATRNGMPTEMIRYYYRHENISTTAGYLKLVGGYDTETIRVWQDKNHGQSQHCGAS